MEEKDAIWSTSCRVKVVPGDFVQYNLPPGSKRGGYDNKKNPPEVQVIINYKRKEKIFNVIDNLFVEVKKIKDVNLSKMTKKIQNIVVKTKPNSVLIHRNNGFLTIEQNDIIQWAQRIAKFI